MLQTRFELGEESGPKDIFEAASSGDLESVKSFVQDKHVSVDSRSLGSGETPLLKAVQGGHFKVVEYLINAGANINHVDKWGYNCVLWAVDQNNTDINMIKYLISYGANFKIKDKKNGYTVLHWAAFHDNLTLVKYLIELSADINAKSVKGETPLDLAAQAGSLDVLDFFIEEQNMQYDIFTAAAKGYTATVRYFIERKVKPVNSADSSGWTPLHRAAYNNRLETVKFLVNEKGAKVNISNKRNSSPLTPLHAAAEEGHTEIVKYLVEKGGDFNSRDSYGRTPLYWAADNGHLNITKFLIDEKKADLNQQDNDGNTLLHAAAWNGQLNIVKYLVDEKKINVNIRDKDKGFTPISEAIQRNNIHVFRHLIEAPNINVNIPDNSNVTPLHYAAQKGYLEIVKSLLDKGADVNTKQRDGRTALYWAADGTAFSPGRLNIVRYFIDEKMCDPFQRDNYGNTLLHAAEWNGSLDIVKYLVEEKGLDVNVKDNDGNTPLSESTQRGKTAIVQYLRSKGAHRRRRSVEPNCYTNRLIINDTPWFSSSTFNSRINSTKNINKLGKTIGLESNSVLHSALLPVENLNGSYTEMTTSPVMGSLPLLDVFLRKINGNPYKQSVHVLSPAQLIEQNIDYNATTAIEELLIKKYE